MIEIKNVDNLSHSFKRHFHDEVSVIQVWSGATVASVAGKDQFVPSGSIVVIPAGLPHACNPRGETKWSYTLALMDPQLFPENIRFSVLPGNESLQAPFRALRGGKSLPSEAEYLESQIVTGLDESLPDEWGQERTPVRRGALKRVESFLRKSLAGPISLDELCALSGLSKYYLLRSFKRAYGFTPHAYLLNLRVNRAKKLLKGGLDLAEAALDCGFCDQSHLSREFTPRVGFTPASYRDMTAISSKM